MRFFFFAKCPVVVICFLNFANQSNFYKLNPDVAIQRLLDYYTIYIAPKWWREKFDLRGHSKFETDYAQPVREENT